VEASTKMDQSSAEPNPPGSGYLRANLRPGLVVAGIFAAALAVGIALATLRAAGAASPPNTTARTAPLWTHPGWGHNRGHDPFHRGPFKHGLFGLSPLHGEFTIAAPGGGYRTIALQTGQVTSVTASAITVKSQDGFSRTYTVDDATLIDSGDNGISDVKPRDTVRIVAVLTGGKARAMHILDVTKVERLHGRWRRGPAAPPEGSDPAFST
jgi:hypothetical protein